MARAATENDVSTEIRTPHGTKYIIEGNLIAPQGRSVRIVTVWIEEHSDRRPRFVTAYSA